MQHDAGTRELKLPRAGWILLGLIATAALLVASMVAFTAWRQVTAAREEVAALQHDLAIANDEAATAKQESYRAKQLAAAAQAEASIARSSLDNISKVVTQQVLQTVEDAIAQARADNEKKIAEINAIATRMAQRGGCWQGVAEVLRTNPGTTFWRDCEALYP